MVQRVAEHGPDHPCPYGQALCYHVTPSVYVRNVRLDAAAVQLRTTSCSVLEILLDCGFENASYFTDAFRARFGCTPRAYRSGTSAVGSAVASLGGMLHGVNIMMY